MPIDNDNSDYESKRIEQRRMLEKQQAKEKQEKDPLHSFEAKLSGEKLKEEAARDSLKKTQIETKKAAEEKGAVLEKILGNHKDSSAMDLPLKAREHEKAFMAQKELKDKTTQAHVKDKKEEDKEEDSSVKDGSQNQESGAAAKSDERVLGLPSGFRDDEDSGSHQGQSADSDGESGFSESRPDEASLSAFAPVKRVSAATDSSGFDSTMLSKDFDEMVLKIEYLVQTQGTHQLKVSLSQDFYDGLEIICERSPKGIILTLVCPNVLVRSKMKEHKAELLKRCAEKNIVVNEVRLT